MCVRFGEFVFDGEARELTRAGERVALSPKAFGLLAALIETRPRALSRSELQDRLWPDSAVGYTSLPAIVTELRHLLRDDRKSPRFIRTVRGFGYAFSGGAADEAVDGTRSGRLFPFSLEWGGHEIGLAVGENLIGRQEGCTIRSNSAKISRHHARVTVTGKGAVLEDLGSKNGTFLRGRRLENPMPLAAGDTISIGSSVLVFRAAFGPGTTATG